MPDVLLHINDDHKASELIRFLHELDFVEVDMKVDQADNAKQIKALETLSGLWNDKDVSLKTIRKKAWRNSL